MSCSSYPWQTAGSNPWEAGIYPRTVDVHRPQTVADGTPNIGVLGYSGITQGTPTGTAGEAIIATGLPCSIQALRMGGPRNQGLLPADAPGPAQWSIHMASGTAAQGTIQDRDILVDDEGARYLVGAAEWNILGYKILCIRLEA